MRTPRAWWRSRRDRRARERLAAACAHGVATGGMTPNEVRARLGIVPIETDPDGPRFWRDVPTMVQREVQSLADGLHGLGVPAWVDEYGRLNWSHPEFAGLIADEIVRQLLDNVRDHPAVRAALDEIYGVTEVMEPQR